MQQEVGKIKQIKLNEDNQELEITIAIMDPKFKKKILRDLSLAGLLSIQGRTLIYTSEH